MLNSTGTLIAIKVKAVLRRTDFMRNPGQVCPDKPSIVLERLNGSEMDFTVSPCTCSVQFVTPFQSAASQVLEAIVVSLA
jgi:hypothetical protein